MQFGEVLYQWLVDEPKPTRLRGGGFKGRVPWPTDAPAPPLAVYIIHWQAPRWCVQTAQSLARSTRQVRVTIIDNGGLDDKAISELPQATTIVLTPDNVGYAGAANRALADWLAGEDEFAVIACHDVVVSPDALDALSAAMAMPDVGIVGIGAGGPQPARSPSRNSDIEVASVSWVSGSCMYLRRSCVLDIGPVDELFGSYLEDVDLCFRAVDRGWCVVSIPEVIVQWEGSISPNASVISGSNSLRLALKRRGWLALPVWLTKQLVLLLLAGVDVGLAPRRGRRVEFRQRWQILCLGLTRHVWPRREPGFGFGGSFPKRHKFGAR